MCGCYEGETREIFGRQDDQSGRFGAKVGLKRRDKVILVFLFASESSCCFFCEDPSGGGPL